ncbi:MAG: hypothetical protein ACRDZR_04085, partial [Acidimicrobiales bacterium]
MLRPWSNWSACAPASSDRTVAREWPAARSTVRAAAERARRRLAESGESTMLFLDEVHRFSKSQQDALLP